MRRLGPAVRLGLVLGAAAALHAAEPEVKAEAGEVLIAEAEADPILAELKASFLRRPCVRAKILSILNDPLLGESTEQGELLLQMPHRFLRRFGPNGKPTKAWLLDGNVVRESSTAQETVNELDFTNAPKKLALLKAAITMDAEVLKDYFILTLFKRLARQDAPVRYRLVLVRRELDKNPVDCSRIEAHWDEGAAFFSEVLRLPRAGKGDPAVERFTEQQVIDRFSEGDFKEPMLERTLKSQNVED